jgi:hypothetical protein
LGFAKAVDGRRFCLQGSAQQKPGLFFQVFKVGARG